jgi:hypothetical protein
MVEIQSQPFSFCGVSGISFGCSGDVWRQLGSGSLNNVSQDRHFATAIPTCIGVQKEVHRYIDVDIRAV